jgi:hypothetical protein
VIRLPKEKIVLIVDTISVGSFPGRGTIDFFPGTVLFQASRTAGLARRTTRETSSALYQDASAEMGQAGKCWYEAEKEFKLPKYESMPGYANGLPFVARRYCALWGRGT